MNQVIFVSNLTYVYPNGRPALQEINWEVGFGERVAVVGRNGAGKSTLLLHLNGTLSGTGEINVAGRPLLKQNLPEIRRLVGMVFQDPDDQLFMPTIFDDVAFGPLNLGLSGETVRQRVADALARVGLAGYENRSPLELSLGEKKRAAMATVLAMEPAVVVLDEPSSNLDPQGRRELIDLLKSLAGTQIIATHDLELVLEVCPQVVVIDGGRVVAQGESRQILADETLMLKHGLEKPWSLKRSFA